jgi:hypothetical protein
MASSAVIAVGKPILKTYRRYAAYKQKFDDWRAVRPFWGGVLLIFAGLLLAYIPFYTLDNFAFTGGTGELIGLIGLVFAFFVFLSGVASITHPQISTLAGMTGIVMSILSVVGGTFGGMGVGTFVGMVGGSLCVAWIQEEETVELDPETAGEQDMEELRKKAQQYEEMVSEGEIDAEDDVEVEDLTLDDEGEAHVEAGSEDAGTGAAEGTGTEGAETEEADSDTGTAQTEATGTADGVEDLTGGGDDETTAEDRTEAEEGAEGTEEGDEDDEDWIP